MSAQSASYYPKIKRGLSTKQVIAAWIMGGGIWLLGMAGLLVVPLYTTDLNAKTTVSADYYSHSGAWTTVQHPSGKYSVVVRGLVPANC